MAKKETAPCEVPAPLVVQCGTRGDIDTAQLIIIGEAPGEEEVLSGVPFVGRSGEELERWLRAAGVAPENCYYENVIPQRPPGNRVEYFFAKSAREGKRRGFVEYLGRWCHPEVMTRVVDLERRMAETPRTQPMILLGGTALWALTGDEGIMKWRGSFLKLQGTFATLHPAAVLRSPEWRYAAIQDVKRCVRNKPQLFPSVPSGRVLETFAEMRDALLELKWQLDISSVVIGADVETTGTQIDCIGLGYEERISNARRIYCYPFFTSNGNVMTVDEETNIVLLLRMVLTHPNARIVGHNWLYDMQYIARNWGFNAAPSDDTLLMEHVWNPRGGKDDKGIPGSNRASTSPPKSLVYLASLYQKDYTYWKWGIGSDRHNYNIKDVEATLDVYETLTSKISRDSRLLECYREKMDEIPAAFSMCLRGVRIDEDRRMQDKRALMDGMKETKRWLQTVLGCGFNPSSAKQVGVLLYDVFRLPKVMRGKTATAGKDAIKALLGRANLEPLLRPILQAIEDYRSMGTLLSTFARASLDSDGRWRCSINLAGTESFRWSTSKDAFGHGSNMQNLTKGDEK